MAVTKKNSFTCSKNYVETTVTYDPKRKRETRKDVMFEEEKQNRTGKNFYIDLYVSTNMKKKKRENYNSRKTK